VRLSELNTPEPQVVAVEERRLAATDSTGRISRLLSRVLLVELAADRIVAVARIAAAADVLLTASIVVVPDSTAIESAEENPESGIVHLVVDLPTLYPSRGVSAMDSAATAATPTDLAVAVLAEQVDST